MSKCYDRQFKLAVAKLILDEDLPIKRISEELGIPNRTLRRAIG